MRSIAFLFLSWTPTAAAVRTSEWATEPDSAPMPVIALLLFIFLLWAIAAENGPLYAWANRNGWLAVALLLLGPALLGVLLV